MNSDGSVSSSSSENGGNIEMSISERDTAIKEINSETAKPVDV